MTSEIKRVSTFVDGNNLFYGIFDIGWHEVLWTDLRALGALIAETALSDFETADVKHFTARPYEVHGSKLKPALWVEFTGANRSHGNVETVQGRFVTRDKSRMFEEKETDANLVAHLCIDAAKNRYDVALVITADTDFIGALRYLRQEIPHIQVVLGLPPKTPSSRQSRKLIRQADSHVSITRDMLRRCQLPELVVDRTTGREYRRPTVQQWSAGRNLAQPIR